MFWNNTAVNLIKEIDTAKAWWCSSAVMFSVKNGRNTIFGIDGPENDDYEHSSLLQLNGKALVQSRLPMCPTCAGMLATGYGIENIDCPELKAARGCMNSEYTGIWDTAEKIKPLLGLLSDGYYALADIRCFPSDGEGHFFYEVPNELKRYEATCAGYYSNYDFSCCEHFPLFLYPTQSSSLIDSERVEYYANILKSEEKAPRALAYHYSGFMNLLLDGHHKACASASLGKTLRCLVIIPANGCSFGSYTPRKGFTIKQNNPPVKLISFAGLHAEAPDGMHYNDIFAKGKKAEADLPYCRYGLTDTKIHYGPSLYPTVRDIAALLNAGPGIFPDMDKESLALLTDDGSDNADRYLEAALNYLASVDHDEAYKLACEIVRKRDVLMKRRRVRAALEFLVNERSEETEQLFIDYYLNHEDPDDNMDIVNSYWNKGES